MPWIKFRFLLIHTWKVCNDVIFLQKLPFHSLHESLKWVNLPLSLIKILINDLITLPIPPNIFPFYGLTNSLSRRHLTLRIQSTNETGSGKVLLIILLLASQHLYKHPFNPTVIFRDSQVLPTASFLSLFISC